MNKCIIMICITILLMWQMDSDLSDQYQHSSSRNINPAQRLKKGKDSNINVLPIQASCHRLDTKRTHDILNHSAKCLLKSIAARFRGSGCFWKIKEDYKTPPSCSFISTCQNFYPSPLKSERLLLLPWSVITCHSISRSIRAADTDTTQWCSSWPRNTTWRTWGPSTGLTGSPQASSCSAGNSISGPAGTKCT